MKNNQFYSDMADECAESVGNGVKTRRVGEHIFKSSLTIKTAEEAKKYGRAAGAYVTLECDTKIIYNEVRRELSRELRAVLNAYVAEIIKGRPPVLVAGLGNRNVTADALGSLVIDRLSLSDGREKGKFKVSGIAAGVYGATGIESLDIIRGVAKSIDAGLIIAVDTLASTRVSRIFKAFQITNAGLEPGSATGAGRASITFKSTGIPVIAIGVPLAIYARSIVYSATERAASDIKQNTKYKVAAEVLGEDNLSMLLTPKEIDEGVRLCAEIIADGINLCFQGSTKK